MKSKITYNPYLSVPQNAINNHVSEAAIRWYIKVNGIDRKLDNAIIKKRKISELKKKNPNISVLDIAKELNLSVSTVRKYLKLEVSSKDSVGDKLSTFDITKLKFVIKSYSFSQDEILNNILRLFIKKERFECDLTYSTGKFYRNIPKPLLRFDKYPQLEDVRPVEEVYQLEDNSLSSIVIDLPFLIRSEISTFHSLMIDRFNHFHSVEELYQVNKDMIELAYKKLNKNGYLVIKTMDLKFGKQIWVSDFVVNTAINLGFSLEDKFILLNKVRLLKVRGEVQLYARKFHSYFFVFKK